MSDLKISIKGKAQSAARFFANARRLNIGKNEKLQLGGEDLGATPLECLLSSYAKCINVVVHLTAPEPRVNLKKLGIAFQGNINPARIFVHSDEKRSGYKKIDVQYSPVKDAAPESINKGIVIIKNICPINDNLAFLTPLTFNYIQKEIPVIN